MNTDCNNVVYLSDDKMASTYCYLRKGHECPCAPHPSIAGMYTPAKQGWQPDKNWKGGLPQ